MQRFEEAAWPKHSIQVHCIDKKASKAMTIDWWADEDRMRRAQPLPDTVAAHFAQGGMPGEKPIHNRDLTRPRRGRMAVVLSSPSTDTGCPAQTGQ